MSKKILILSTGDNHGAYEAAYKIAKFLYEDNYQVALVVKYKTKGDPFIVQIKNVKKADKTILYKVINKIKNKIIARRKSSFTTDSKYLFLTKDENANFVSAESILENISFVPELILVGMTNDFCTTNTLAKLYKKTNAKIYTWLVDMEPLTGGCHYAWDCKGYQDECKKCPAILEDEYKDKAHINFKTKEQNIQSSNIKVLSGSQWVAEQAKNSTLYKSQAKIFNTHACIDTRILNGKNRDFAKRIFGIPKNAKVLFTGSWNVNDPRKGMAYFLEALNYLWDAVDQNLKDQVYILIAGEHYQQVDFLSSIPFKKMHIDYIKDYRLLSLAYQAADIFVCASIEDSGPMMVSEALACGTPVVGFKMGNVYSMVENEYNGYVAELKNSKDLAKGLNKILSLSKEEFEKYSTNSIKKVEAIASHKAAVKAIESLFSDN